MRRGALNKRILCVKENISPSTHQPVELVENSPLDSKKSKYSQDLACLSDSLLLLCFTVTFSDFHSSDSETNQRTKILSAFPSMIFISNHLIAWAHSDLICIFDLDRQTMVGNLEHPSSVSCLVLMSNGLLASCSADNLIHIWSIAEEKVIRCYGAENRNESKSSVNSVPIHSICAMPDGQLASLSEDSKIKIWDLHSSKGNPILEISNFSEGGDSDLGTAEANSNPDRDEAIDIGVLSNGHLVTCFDHHYTTYYGLYKHCKIATRDTFIRVWNPRNGKLVKSFQTTVDDKSKRSERAIQMIVLSNDNVLVEFHNYLIGIYDLTKATMLFRLSQPCQRAHFGFAQHPNGSLFSFPHSKTETNGLYSFHVYSPEDGQLIDSYHFRPGRLGGTQMLAISPDGRRLICGNSSVVDLLKGSSSPEFPSSMFSLS